MKFLAKKDFKKRSFAQVLVLPYFEESLQAFNKSYFSKKCHKEFLEDISSLRFGDHSFTYAHSVLEDEVVLLGLGNKKNLTTKRLVEALLRVVLDCYQYGLITFNFVLPKASNLKDLPNVLADHSKHFSFLNLNYQPELCFVDLDPKLLDADYEKAKIQSFRSSNFSCKVTANMPSLKACMWNSIFDSFNGKPSSNKKTYFYNLLNSHQSTRLVGSSYSTTSKDLFSYEKSPEEALFFDVMPNKKNEFVLVNLKSKTLDSCSSKNLYGQSGLDFAITEGDKPSNRKNTRDIPDIALNSLSLGILLALLDDLI